MRTSVVGLSSSQAKAFCIRLWLELTIAGRSIWSDESLSPAAQLDSLKWLNEMQHRVWGAYSSAHPNALAQLLDQVLAHANQAPNLEPHLRLALDRALLAASGGKDAPTGPSS